MNRLMAGVFFLSNYKANAPEHHRGENANRIQIYQPQLPRTSYNLECIMNSNGSTYGTREHMQNPHLIDIIFIAELFTFLRKNKEVKREKEKKTTPELLSTNGCLFRSIFKTMRYIVAGHNVTRVHNLANKTMQF